MSEKRKDLYISHPAVLCSAGRNTREFWHSLLAGSESGIKKRGEMFLGAVDDAFILQETQAKFNMRITRLLDTAIEEIDSEIRETTRKFGRSRVGVVLGSCDNGTELSLSGHRKYFETGSFSEPYTLEMQGASYLSSFLSDKYSITGPAFTVATACSSSASAVVKAAELVLSGAVDAVVTGGVDIISETVRMGFSSLEAVSKERTNPFSTNRSGMTLGEGAAFFILSRERPVAESKPVKLLGWGESADAYHITSPDVSGSGAARAMTNALEKAGLKAQEIDYVSLHGTGTRYNDAMEARAMEKVFGSYAVPCSAVKSITGHTLGAAGAIGLLSVYLTLRNNFGRGTLENPVTLPAQIWDGEFDSSLPHLNIIDNRNNKIAKEVKIGMTNSFGFGGANVSLILGLSE